MPSFHPIQRESFEIFAKPLYKKGFTGFDPTEICFLK